LKKGLQKQRNKSMKILIKSLLALLLAFQLHAQNVSLELFKKAEKHFKKREYKKAQLLYENLVEDKNFSKREMTLFRLGHCYYYLRNKEKAYITLTRLMEEYPSTPHLKPSLKIIVDYLKIKKEFNKAAQLLKENLSKNPDDIEMKKLLLQVYEESQDYKKALNLLENNFPPNVWFAKKKSYYLKEQKQYDLAINFLIQKIKEFDSIELYSILADIYELNLDYDNSSLWYEKLYTKTKKNIYLFNEARMLLSNNLTTKARPVINKILKKLGENINTYKQIADLYKEFGIYDELLIFYEKAIKKGYDFKKEKINILEIMGKYEEAVYSYLKMLDNTNYYFILERMENLAIYEEQYPLVEKLLVKYEDKFQGKKELILKLQMQMHLKFNELSKLVSILKNKYFSVKKIDFLFLESLINSLFTSEHFEYIIEIYKLIPVKIKKNINPAIKLRYAQSLYLFEQYNLSLAVLNTLKNKAMVEKINYYKSLNYFELKNFPEALKYLKNLSTYEAFDLHIKILLLQGKIKQAQKLVARELKRKKFPGNSLSFNEIIISLFLHEYTIMVQDIKKHLSIYPQDDKSNDLALMLFLIQNDLIKNHEEKKTGIMDFFRSYYLNDYKVCITSLKSLEFNVDNIDSIIYYFLAKCYIYEKKIDKAINELNGILKKETFVKPYALELLGWIYQNKKKNKDSAKKYYKQILSEYPSFININNIRKILTN